MASARPTQQVTAIVPTCQGRPLPRHLDWRGQLLGPASDIVTAQISDSATRTSSLLEKQLKGKWRNLENPICSHYSVCLLVYMIVLEFQTALVCAKSLTIILASIGLADVLATMYHSIIIIKMVIVRSRARSVNTAVRRRWLEQAALLKSASRCALGLQEY